MPDMPDQKSTTQSNESSKSQSLTNQSSVDANVPHALANLAEGVMGEAKKAAEFQISDRKAKVADSLGGVAHALRQATSARHEPVIESVRPYVEKAADQVDRASTYLQDSSFRDMAGDLEGLARREPALFLGGSLLLGIIGGRFLKSSAPDMAPAQANASSSYANTNGANRQHAKNSPLGNSNVKDKDNEKGTSADPSKGPRDGVSASATAAETSYMKPGSNKNDKNKSDVSASHDDKDDKSDSNGGKNRKNPGQA